MYSDPSIFYTAQLVLRGNGLKIPQTTHTTKIKFTNAKETKKNATKRKRAG